ncbi:MAG TPA: hypothetical protein VL854_03005 [Nitrososphaeraceae archaeon]|nr:hypothetical protein [Nitrososphaeraceae archaeon]
MQMQHDDWLKHPWTERFLRKLEEEYQWHIDHCVEHADNATKEILVKFRLELSAASTIKHILNYGRTGNYYT